MQEESVEEAFSRLARTWAQETGALSNVRQIAMHSCYQAIIGLGKEAVPLMLSDLQNHPRHWFWALHAITRANPVPAEARGNLLRMTEAWVTWGQKNGYRLSRYESGSVALT
jgi:hypothetical protein